MSTRRWKSALPDDAVRVLVVDAHDAARIGLGVLLQRQRWVQRCLLARDRAAAVTVLRRESVDVAVVDVSEAGVFLADVLGSLRAARPAVQLVVTSRCPLRLPAPLEQLGAAAILRPAAGAAEVVATVQGALLGSPPLPPEPAPGPEAVALTVRQRQILELLAAGATNREIAASLHLGTDSVKKHATLLYRRLGVRNRTEAAQRAADLLASPSA